MKIILGSASPQRKAVMETLNIPFEVLVAGIDEKAIRFEDPEQLTRAIAHAKAEALRKRIYEPAILIAADLVVVCKGSILEKPTTADEAQRFLKGYVTHPAETIASVVVTNTATGAQAQGTDRARIYFTPIPNNVIQQLIDIGEIFTQAGAFSIDDPLIKPYIQKMEGAEDSIMGLPLQLTKRLLRDVGYQI